MAPHAPTHRAASPKRRFFDPWNSASTGHQRAENRLSGSTSWRNSRNAKLHSQFAAGFASGGGKRMYDSVGAGSKDFGEDGRTDTGWEDSTRGWRGRQGIGKDQPDIGDWVKSDTKTSPQKMPEKESPNVIQGLDEESEEGNSCKRIKSMGGKPVAVSKTLARSPSPSHDNLPPPSAQPPRLQSTPLSSAPASPTQGDDVQAETLANDQQNLVGGNETFENAPPPQIFANLTIYINGSTMPLVSDHKLKHLLTTHGARMSIALGRRSVTHVILGKANSGVGKGAGGGLAGSKIEKEILRRGGSGNAVRYVTVEWVLESIEARKRLPESRFPGVNIAPAGVKSVRSMFSKRTI